MTKIRYLDTFAGVGGFHLALEQSIGKENIECIGYSEIDKFAKQVYLEHFPNTKDLGSITEIDIEKLDNFDLLTGGFPCQDVSVAGKQDLSKGRTVLVEYLLQILEKKKPKYFIFENVKGLLSKKFDTFRNSIIKRIMEAGYNTRHYVLNTKDFGLPQNRERVFIVGSLEDNFHHDFDFPAGQELKIFLRDILEEEVDEKYFLSEEKTQELIYNDTESKVVANVNPSGKGMNGNVYRIDTEAPTLTTNKGEGIKIVNATNQGYLKAVPGDSIVLDNPKSTTKRSRVKHGICSTLTCAGGYGILENDYRIRKLTPIEYARLQGFPDGWSTDFVSNSQTYKQMGNAISVPVVKAIFDNLL